MKSEFDECGSINLPNQSSKIGDNCLISNKGHLKVNDAQSFRGSWSIQFPDLLFESNCGDSASLSSGLVNNAKNLMVDKISKPKHLKIGDDINFEPPCHQKSARPMIQSSLRYLKYHKKNKEASSWKQKKYLEFSRKQSSSLLMAELLQ